MTRCRRTKKLQPQLSAWMADCCWLQRLVVSHPRGQMAFPSQSTWDRIITALAADSRHQRPCYAAEAAGAAYHESQTLVKFCFELPIDPGVETTKKFSRNCQPGWLTVVGCNALLFRTPRGHDGIPRAIDLGSHHYRAGGRQSASASLLCRRGCSRGCIMARTLVKFRFELPIDPGVETTGIRPQNCGRRIP